MKCPFCGHLEDRVIDSRAGGAGDVIRRRRECASCERRFTTYERVEDILPTVVKKDGETWIEGLKLQSNSSRGLRAWKSAALVRRQSRRWWRTFSSSWRISSRNSPWDRRLAAASCKRTGRL